MPLGPRFLRWWMVSPSGPMDEELEESLMALWTSSGVKGVKVGSRGCFLWRLRKRRRVDFLDVCLNREVYCLQKAFARDLGLV